MINGRVRAVFRRSFGFPREFNEEEYDGGFPAVSLLSGVFGSGSRTREKFS